MLLAEIMMTSQDVDPVFTTKLLITIYFLVGLVSLVSGVVFIAKRKPSIDVDLTQIKGRLEGIETGNSNHRELQDMRHSENRSRLEAIAQRLTDGDSTMADLSAKQAVNSEAIQNIKGDIHEMKLTARDVANYMMESSKKRS